MLIGLATVPLAIDAAQSVAGFLGFGGGSSPSNDQILALGLPTSIIGPLGLRAELAGGVLAGKTIADWATGGSTGAEQRSFFRLLAVRVGAIDAGYATRVGGMEAARLAFRKYATLLDSQLGTNLATHISSNPKDSGNLDCFPQRFTTEFLAVPLAKMVSANDYILGGPGGGLITPQPLAAAGSITGAPTAAAAGTTERLTSELDKIWEAIKQTGTTIITGTIEGAATGARTTTEGAATGAKVGSSLLNPVFIVLLIVGIIFAAKYIRR